jgi:hypothetical protein
LSRDGAVVPDWTLRPLHEKHDAEKKDFPHVSPPE